MRKGKRVPGHLSGGILPRDEVGGATLPGKQGHSASGAGKMSAFDSLTDSYQSRHTTTHHDERTQWYNENLARAAR